MPNLSAHIDLAYQTAQRLDHPTLEVNMGYFLLGSTSPDIRVITRRKREEYHFVPLSFKEVGEGVDALFNAHPNLLRCTDYDGPTQAFICGYITHLIADETWIVNMFRPFFDNPEVFEDVVLGRVMDRALQLELDRQAWHVVEPNLPLVEAANNGIGVGFIPPETLTDWCNWVVASLNRGFSWERLRFMAKRIAAGNENHPAHQIAEEFIQSAPQSLEDLYQLVPRHKLEDFKEQTVESLVQSVGEYLP